MKSNISELFKIKYDELPITFKLNELLDEIEPEIVFKDGEGRELPMRYSNAMMNGFVSFMFRQYELQMLRINAEQFGCGSISKNEYVKLAGASLDDALKVIGSREKDIRKRSKALKTTVDMILEIYPNQTELDLNTMQVVDGYSLDDINNMLSKLLRNENWEED